MNIQGNVIDTKGLAARVLIENRSSGRRRCAAMGHNYVDLFPNHHVGVIPPREMCGDASPAGCCRASLALVHTVRPSTLMYAASPSQESMKCTLADNRSSECGGSAFHCFVNSCSPPARQWPPKTFAVAAVAQKRGVLRNALPLRNLSSPLG